MITLRRNLDRPLTAEEVDANFETLLNMINGTEETFFLDGYKAVRASDGTHTFNVVDDKMYSAGGDTSLVYYVIDYETMTATNVSGFTDPVEIPEQLFIVDGEGGLQMQNSDGIAVYLLDAPESSVAQ